MRALNVLIGCEFSQVITKEFRDKGHNAFSCDLLPTEGNPDWHLRCNVLDLINNPSYHWDLMIFHPECTRLCNSGVLRLYKDGKKINGIDPVKWQEMIKAAEFFLKLYNANCKHICIENPVMHGHAVRIIGKRHDQTIQPYQFGEDASKRTCLWLKNLPKLVPTNIIKKDYYANQTPSGQNKLGPGKDRWKERSRTYPGIAKAICKQYLDFLQNFY